MKAGTFQHQYKRDVRNMVARFLFENKPYDFIKIIIQKGGLFTVQIETPGKGGTVI